jgi:acetamidase/formamidase
VSPGSAPAIANGPVSGLSPLTIAMVSPGFRITLPNASTVFVSVGAYRPLDDALRIAFTELVSWIHADYGLSELDAYELLSKVARIHLAEMVDPNYVVIAGIDKKYLPPQSRNR